MKSYCVTYNWPILPGWRSHADYKRSFFLEVQFCPALMITAGPKDDLKTKAGAQS